MDYADGGLNNARFRATATTQAVDAPFARFKAARRFQALDGWRAFAIIAVIWHHTLTDSFTSPIAYEGRHGVTLFFVISGFLIVTLLLRARESPHGFSLWRFWGRRSLRILPIYYAVLAIYIGLVYLQRGVRCQGGFLRQPAVFRDIHDQLVRRCPRPHDLLLFLVARRRRTVLSVVAPG